MVHKAAMLISDSAEPGLVAYAGRLGSLSAKVYQRKAEERRGKTMTQLRAIT